jgi:hypothetical protein
VTKLTLDEPVDFTIEQGVDFAMDFEPFADDANTERAVLDGFVVIIQGRRHRGHPDLLFEWTTDTGELTIEDAINPLGKMVRCSVNSDATRLVESAGSWTMIKHLPGAPEDAVLVYAGRYGLSKAGYRREQ